jgi:hypothetical protein
MQVHVHGARASGVISIACAMCHSFQRACSIAKAGDGTSKKMEAKHKGLPLPIWCALLILEAVSKQLLGKGNAAGSAKGMPAR